MPLANASLKIHKLDKHFRDVQLVLRLSRLSRLSLIRLHIVVAHLGLASLCDASHLHVCNPVGSNAIWTTDKSSNRQGIVMLVGHRILIRYMENHVMLPSSWVFIKRKPGLRSESVLRWKEDAELPLLSRR